MVDAAWIALTFNANARRVAGERMKYMRKKVIALSAMPTAERVEVEWLNLGNLAHVEVTRRVLIFRLSPSSGSETGRVGALQNRVNSSSGSSSMSPDQSIGSNYGSQSRRWNGTDPGVYSKMVGFTWRRLP
jgi:hypothetical protein